MASLGRMRVIGGLLFTETIKFDWENSWHENGISICRNSAEYCFVTTLRERNSDRIEERTFVRQHTFLQRNFLFIAICYRIADRF